MNVSYFKIDTDEFPIKDILTTEVWVKEDKNSHQFTVMHANADYLEQVVEDLDIRVHVKTGSLYSLMLE